MQVEIEVTEAEIKKDLRDEIIGQLTVALEYERKQNQELRERLGLIREKIEMAAEATKYKGYWA